MTAITNIWFKIFLDAVLGPKNPKNYQGVENQVFEQFSVKRDFETQHFVYVSFVGYILVQHEILNPNMLLLTF